MNNLSMVDFIGFGGKVYKRQPVECYQRVMGYCRPVHFYNKGKQSEFYSRSFYTEYEKFPL